MVSDLISNMSVWLGPLCVLLAGFVVTTLIWLKTRSLHFLWQRIWQLFGPSLNEIDEDVRRAVKDESSVMCFRWAFGVRARTLIDCRNFIVWARERDIALREIGACRHYFDMNKLVVKVPSRWTCMMIWVAVVLSAVIVAFLMKCLLADNVLARVKSSGTTFLLSADHARPVWSLSDGFISRDSCLKVSASTSQAGFTVADTKILCSIFDEPEPLERFMKKGLKEQRIFLVPLLALAFLGFFGLLSNFLAVIASERLARKLADDKI